MKEFSETAVSWSLTSLFSTSVVIPETKSQGGKLSVPRKGRPAILTSTLATFLCSHPKGKGIERLIITLVPIQATTGGDHTARQN